MHTRYSRNDDGHVGGEAEKKHGYVHRPALVRFVNCSSCEDHLNNGGGADTVDRLETRCHQKEHIVDLHNPAQKQRADESAVIHPVANV